MDLIKTHTHKKTNKQTNKQTEHSFQSMNMEGNMTLEVMKTAEVLKNIQTSTNVNNTQHALESGFTVLHFFLSFFFAYWDLTLFLCVVSALQLAMRGPPGPMGLTGRSGPVVSLSWLFVGIWHFSLWQHSSSNTTLLFNPIYCTYRKIS